MLRPGRRVGAWLSQKDWLWVFLRGSVSSVSRYQSWAWAWNVGVLLILSTAAHHNFPNANPTTTTPSSSPLSFSSPFLSSADYPPSRDVGEAPPALDPAEGSQEDPGERGVTMTEVQVYKVMIASAILVFWSVFWVVHLIGIIYGYRRLHHRRALSVESGDQGVMGVSILKPLVGTPMDPNLMTNLETFFTLNYPKFELLFCVQEEGDPSIMIVQQLMKKHPHVDASCFTGGLEVGVNPKINNMQPGYQAAKHELLMVSDSSLLMKEDTLTDMVAHMTPDVGIVHQMPFTCDRKGWPAILEKVYFGTGHARMYLFLGLLDALGFGVNCCTGMSCLMRKKVLDEAGGISAFGIYLAEDYFFAKYIQDRGWGIRIASQPAWQNAGTCRVKNFLSRLTRWCKLRIAMVPHTLVLEPVTECMVLGLVVSWAATVLLHADYLTFFLFHTLTWSLADWIMLNIVQNGPPPFSKFEFVISWLFREVSALFIFLHAVWNPVISWRTGSFKLRWWGVAEPVNTRVTVM
ncbi:ceramide glucosyltransferase-like isoform X1 [Homarus americanus]|uniref:ceramide glucosyltransferase-like isoform X1 n=1 Tax=Homarus americanus TaxID=6706 RepID=UPI001C47C053|nr:ceramide glucosyltransferase-like isoform X1 [Homarus americanus]XP_042214781.1 ceramide glucosyltransferase-like isoform X1 [Homarus americanus]XP_042214782.1 ceramide glucosyltransferase-like isoform X1 [Homarus americanus]